MRPKNSVEKTLNVKELSQYHKRGLSERGLDLNDYTAWKRKWRNHLRNSELKQTITELTFLDYVQKAVDAGLTNPSQIGQHAGQYCLGRISDEGPYTVRSCRFITMEQNAAERVLNGKSPLGYSKHTHEKIAELSRRRTLETKETSSRIQKQSRAVSRSFRLVDPWGRVFIGSNLNEFCKTHGLNTGNMAAVCRGDKIHSKQWTGKYIQKLEE